MKKVISFEVEITDTGLSAHNDPTSIAEIGFIACVGKSTTELMVNIIDALELALGYENFDNTSLIIEFPKL